MAADCVGLLDALGLASVHLVGASMGGFIAQTVAIEYPARVRSFDRAFDPIGMARQAVAVVASGDRTAKLRELHVPALVIHGGDDKMCDVSGGRATAAAIPGAELIVIDGMGHDLPAALWPQLAGAIAAHVLRATA
jgi:pimeloyl-ACP methyl ester carboxylesterase